MREKVKRNIKKSAALVLAATMVASSVAPSISMAHENRVEVKNEQKQLESKYLTEQQRKQLKSVSDEQRKSDYQAITRADYDKSITSLSLKVEKHKFTKSSFAPNTNPKNAYDGQFTLTSRYKTSGILAGKNMVLPNSAEFIQDFEEGNYGAYVRIQFPKGVDARAMFNTIDWDNSSATDHFNVKVAGIPTPFPLVFPSKFDPSTAKFYADKPNEFLILVRGIKKSEVSEGEWNSWDTAAVYTALTAAGIAHMGSMTGWNELSLSFDLNKYTGNVDDHSKGKVLTKGMLPPSPSRKLDVNMYGIDRTALTAGVNGKKNIAGAEIIPGKEYINKGTTSDVPTWDSYLSVWDNELKYNTNDSEEMEVMDEKNALPGASIYNRDLLVAKGDNFNDFSSDRFNRVVNYFTKENITEGMMGDVNTVTINHLPSKVPDNKKTPVKYTGNVSYVNGDVRSLVPATINVTNNAQPASEGTIIPDTFTIGDTNITGKYTGDVKTLRLYINGVSVAWGGSLQDGKFTFYAGNQKITANDKLTMNAYDKDNNLLQENVPVNVKEEAAATGSINPAMYTPGDTNITGTYTGNVAHAKLFVNGNYVSAGGDFSNGVFTYYAGGKIKAGDKAYLVAMDKTGKELDRKDIKINASSTTTGSINPSAYTEGENTISGSYTGDVALMHLLVNGKSISWGGTLSNGSFSYYVKAGTIKAGDIVTLEAYDQNNNKLDSKRVQVNGKVTSGSIDSATYKLGETTIKGTFSGDIVVAKVYINGVAQAWGGEFGGGGFSYYVGKNKIKAGDNVAIEGYDKDTKLLGTKKVTILN
ncbi:immunoglobulin-like domain-containing protein [Listeria kieliensis]